MADENIQNVVPETQPPETVGEQVQPEDPSILGKLTEQELAGLAALQQQSMNLQSQIGGLEVRKAHVLGMMQQIKDQGQAILDAAAQRFGIKPGERWSVAQDGTVRRGPEPHPTPGV